MVPADSKSIKDCAGIKLGSRMVLVTTHLLAALGKPAGVQGSHLEGGIDLSDPKGMVQRIRNTVTANIKVSRAKKT
jgi:hypothetical protein